MSILTLEQVNHVYSAGTPFEHPALIDVNLTVKRGELLGLIGHTGSGKSTLIQHFNGLLRPTSGRVLYEGEDVWATKERVRRLRFQVGLVFQYPEYQLFEETVFADIAFGPKNMGLDAAELEQRVRRAAQFVELSPELLEKSPFDLSGGEKRRAAIAGVIAMEPEVLILDEPTAGLDPAGRERILRNIRAYHKIQGNTVLIVTHSMDIAAALADRLVVMNQGRIAMTGTPREVFARAQELGEMGLAVPEVTRIFRRLKELGAPVDPAVYTLKEARRALLALKGGRGGA